MSVSTWIAKRFFGCGASDAERVRRQVSTTYARAVEKRAPCCGPASADRGVPHAAGYTDEQLDRVPASAAASSFGCGNPVAFADVEPGDVVVDLGSGAGLDLILAAERVGREGRVIGIEMTDAMIARSRMNAARSGHSNIDVRRGVVEDLPLDDASVDVVVSNCVLNLATDKPAAFREIARVLRPGGTISISDIVAEDLPEWVRTLAGAHAACVAGAISEASYVAGLEAAGLVDVRVADRLVYERDQILALVKSDLPGVTPELVDRALPAVAGKIQSIRVHARKP